MTPQEIERTMEFILEHHAKFAADIQKLFESDDRLRQSQATLTAALVRVTEIMEDLAESQKGTDGRLRQTDDHLRRTDEQLRQTDERLRQTDDRLNALLHIVERHVTGPNHGHAPQ